MTLAAATALHAGVAAVVLALAPALLPMPEPIEIEIVSLPAAPPQDSSAATETAEAERPDPAPADIAPAESRADRVIESSSPVAELAPSEPVPQPIAEKPSLPPPPHPPPPRPKPQQTSPTATAQPPVPSTSAPEPSVSGTATPQATITDAVAAPPVNTAPQTDSAYVGRLLAWLERFKEYPRAARLRRMEGQVVVRLSILADGRVAAATVATSSGHSVLDSAALDTVRRANPLPAPDGGPVELLVPIVFELRDERRSR